MSCFPESHYSVYVDGELPSDQVRAVDAHLITCLDCRGLVVALRDEVSLLDDLLHERQPVPVQGVARTAPARSLALGLFPTLSMVALGVVVLRWLIAQTPASIDWLNPLQSEGAYDMAFNVIFLLREQAPEFLDLLVAMASVATVAVLLSFLLSALFRRWTGPATLALLALTLGTSPSHAIELIEEEHIDIREGEKIEGPVVASAERMRVDGEIDGNLFVAAERFTLRGVVRGDIFALVEDFELDGRLEGSLHCICGRTSLMGDIDGHAYVTTGNFGLEPKAKIARDLWLIGKGAVIEGEVGRDFSSFSTWIDLRGKVGRDLFATERISLAESAEVGRNIINRLTTPDPEPEIAEGARVGGSVEVEHDYLVPTSLLERYRDPGFYLLHGAVLVGLFLAGMLLFTLLPGAFRMRLDSTPAFFRTLGIGFATLVATPPVLALLALTVVGIPLAIMGLWIYLAAIYLSIVFVAAVVGTALIHRDTNTAMGFGLALLAGLVGLFGVGHLPFVGVLFSILIMLTGLGLAVEHAVRSWRRGGFESI